MVIPSWARLSGQKRLTFFVRSMALSADPAGNLVALCKAADVNYGTLVKALRAGRLSQRLAAQLVDASPDSDVRVTWLVAPEAVAVDPVTGEVTA